MHTSTAVGQGACPCVTASRTAIQAWPDMGGHRGLGDWPRMLAVAARGAGQARDTECVPLCAKVLTDSLGQAAGCEEMTWPVRKMPYISPRHQDWIGASIALG